jgi:hypothetical protein
MRRGRSPSPLQKSTDHPPASYDRDLALKHDHIRCSSASSRLTVSPLGRRLHRPSPTGTGRFPAFERSGSTPDNTHGGAVASTGARRRSGQLRPTPAGSRSVFTDTRRAGQAFAARCLTTVHHDRAAHMQAPAQGAVSCRRLSHLHFCNRLHRRHRISKMSIWFSTAILLDEAAAARAVH